MKKKNLFLTMALALTLMSQFIIKSVEAEEIYQPGVTVEPNTNQEWDADYMVTFVYEDIDPRDVVSVNLQGGFQFYKEVEVGDYKGSGDNTAIPCYNAFEYETGMFASSYSTQTGTMTPYVMTEIADEVFQVTIPLPANQYFYAYYVTYEGATEEVKIYDPANLPESNAGADAGWSIFYVGNGETGGQEYIYPSDNNQGTVEYLSYEAIDGSTQSVGVYKPYNYDSNKTYKTIYVSHGGGGNEVEWMTIGSVPNIIDNLLTDKEVAECIVVTMNNQIFGWDYDVILPNIIEYIKPLIEDTYSVSRDAKDRAFCGLSMGSMTTNMMSKVYPEEFGYFGAFSGGTQDLDPNNYDADAMNQTEIYLTAGCIDMAYNNEIGISTLDYITLLEDLGVDYTFELKLGGHDWYVWRDSFTTFVKDYLWDYEYVTTASDYPEGVSVGINTNSDYSSSDYAVTFVYQDNDVRDAISVQVTGNLQFYRRDSIVNNYITTGDATGAIVYDVFEYEEGMINTGYGLNGDSVYYSLTETADERFEITLPLPGNLYYYDYVVTYSNGDTVTIQDPVNLSASNSYNGHDAGHSMVYVGDSSNTISGQEYVYPRTDDKVGCYTYVTYTAIDGTIQPLGVYLPYNYDSSKRYKTIYVSHGGGGNEAEWMTIGALPNIMDNLLADQEVAECIVVTMDHTYFSWNYDVMAENMTECIIPYIESNYSVSTNAKDRAMCGLSMGSMTTSTFLQTITDTFGYYGCFSGANVAAEVEDVELLKDVVIYLNAGNLDMALMNSSYGTSTDRTTMGFVDKLNKLGIEYSFETKDGAHDWGVWRDSLTTFVKDYLWDTEITKDIDNKDDTVINDDTTPVETGDALSGVGYLYLLVGATVSIIVLSMKKNKS